MNNIQKKNHKPYSKERTDEYFDKTYKRVKNSCKRNNRLQFEDLSIYDLYCLSSSLFFFLYFNPHIKFKDLKENDLFKEYSEATLQNYYTQFYKAQKRVFELKLEEVKIQFNIQ